MPADPLPAASASAPRRVVLRGGNGVLDTAARLGRPLRTNRATPVPPACGNRVPCVVSALSV